MLMDKANGISLVANAALNAGALAASSKIWADVEDLLCESIEQGEWLKPITRPNFIDIAEAEKEFCYVVRFQ